MCTLDGPSVLIAGGLVLCASRPRLRNVPRHAWATCEEAGEKKKGYELTPSLNFKPEREGQFLLQDATYALLEFTTG